MATIAASLVALLLTTLLVYYFAPGVFYCLGMTTIRLRSGLRVRTLSVDGVTWSYLVGGNPRGEPMVLIHGFAADKDNWSFYARHIKNDYALILPDLPGFGDSDPVKNADYSVAAQAARLEQFLQKLCLGKCHVGGNSMGGFIALRLAIDYPERFLSLTLFDNGGVRGERTSQLEQAAAHGENLLAVRNLADFDRMIAFAAYRPVAIPARIRWFLFKRMKAHQQLLEDIFKQLFDDSDRHPLNEFLHAIAIPTLIIWGRHDRLIDISCVNAMRQAIPVNEVAILEEVGHIPMLEQPAETARLQMEFLSRHRADACRLRGG